VGAKLALAILSGMSVDDFSRCVQAGDTASLTRLPGIGKRTAERLVVEMRDRLDKLGPGHGGGAVLSASAVYGAGSPADEAASALAALGYKPAEAQRMIRAVEAPGLASEELIRAALKAAAKG
jgi:Holliday junction DNA helicase RuvA